MRSPAPFLPLLFTAAVFPLVAWGVWSKRRRSADNLRRLAGVLGIEFQPARGWTGSARASGPMRGRAVDVFTFVTGGGKSSTTWAAVSARLGGDGRGLTFRLQNRGLVAKVMEMFGAGDITTGDASFDAAWFVRTNQPEFFGAALIPELRDRLRQVREAGAKGTFELKQDAVRYAEQGSFASAPRADRFAALANAVCDLADVADVYAARIGPP